MSDPSAGRHHFLSWARRGIGALVNTAPVGQSRVTVNVQISVVDQTGAKYPSQPNPVAVQLYGPGDVIGIDPRHIIRTEPLKGTVNFEPNYLCAIEFDSPDFPWVFTPAAPGGLSTPPSFPGCPSGDRLAPWIALIVLKQTEYSAYSPNATNPGPPNPPPPNPLPVITVCPSGTCPGGSPLQNLSDSWNWAHVQVNGDARLDATLASAAGNVISRLICPRRLDPETAYTAFLVPAFQIGCLAGMKQDTSGVDPNAPSWNMDTKFPLNLPVYYQLDFRTSDEGDFESLVRRLKLVGNLSETVGQHLMDVSLPGMGLPPAATEPLGMEGAFASLSMQSTPWNPNEKAPFQESLQKLINQTSRVVDDPSSPQKDDPVIVPPIYGRWGAGVSTVHAGSQNWLDDLNLDPRTRAAAGLGTQVVQDERTQLLASAWQQVDGILAANEKIQHGQLARVTLGQVYSNKFGAATTGSVLGFTAPLQSRVLNGPKTVLATVRNSHVPERALSPVYRRVTRPRRRLVSPIAKRESLLGKINEKKVVIAPRPVPPQGLVSLDEISEQREKSLHKRLLEILAAIELARRSTTSITRRFFLTIALGLAAVGVGAAILGTEVWEELEELFAGRRSAERIRLSSFTPQQVQSIPARPNFTLTGPNVPPAQGGTGGGGDSPQAKSFRSGTTDLFSAIQAHPVDPPERPSLHLSTLQQTVLTRLDPNVTVAQRMKAIVSLPRLSWQPQDFLASPILAAPDFPQPVYLALLALSPSYLLPGAEQVPPDSLSIVVQNHKFIESFMVGLNHEMTRQLIWENYPIFDQRGTYFRQFWDVSSYIPQNGDPTDANTLADLLKDIPPFVPRPNVNPPFATGWSNPLGKNLNRTDLPPKNVVLLVRGELFRRYPNTVVYAVKAKPGPDGKLVHDDTDQRYPLFRGTLPTDITFLGFNLTVADAIGGSDNAPDGFFFVFQQPPGEPRFGLEPVESPGQTTKWADLSWLNFAGTQASASRKLASMAATIQKLAGNSPWRYTSQIFSQVLQDVQLPSFLSSSLYPSGVGPLSDPDDRQNNWGQNSAQTAYVLLRMPFRILIRACLLLGGCP
jgi:hypothetical protein